MVNNGRAMTNEAPTSAVHEAIAQLQQLAELFQRRREQLARACGLTVQQWRVLEEISQEHFMPSMFARERDSSRAAVSKILRQLQDKGLIAAGISPLNGRHREYLLTPAGEETMERLRALRARAIEEVWGGLSDERLARFTEFSADLIGRLEAYSEGTKES